MNYPKHDKVNLQHVLYSLCPRHGWAIENGEKIVWQHPKDPSIPKEKDILARFKKLIKEFDANEYKELRKAEYEKLNQLELQFDDMQNGTTTWADAVNEIKKRYPKP